jgi:hypothetical protein
MTEGNGPSSPSPVEPARLPCGHSKERAWVVRRGPRLVRVCRTCRRWFHERPSGARRAAVEALPGFRPASEIEP